MLAIHASLAGEIAAPAATPSRITAAPSLVPPVATAPPTPTLRQPVPAGTCYLVAPVSVRISNGITGFAPGQAVRLVHTDAKTGRLLITDGQHPVEVTPAQLTTDANLAATLRQPEEANRRAVQAAREASALAQGRYEAALRRIELNRDLELASHVSPHAPIRATTIYDRSYHLRGDLYHAAHEVIPPVQGPHSAPGSLVSKSNGLGYY